MAHRRNLLQQAGRSGPQTGGCFLFNVWDAIEQNDLPHIAHAIISKFFDDNPPDFYEVPFSLHDPEIIRSLLSGAGFKEIQVSLLPLPAISQSAQAVAKGLVHGNPVINAIRERDESSVPAIEAAVAAAVAAQCGDAPVRAADAEERRRCFGRMSRPRVVFRLSGVGALDGSASPERSR